MPDTSNVELLAALGLEVEEKEKPKSTPREERIIAGFEEIQRFVESQGRVPSHGEEREIFERIYATRLDQIKKSEECRSILADIDHQGLLTGEAIEPQVEFDSDEELLAELGIEMPTEGDVRHLKYVKPRSQVDQPKDKAIRKPCEDFELFSEVFNTIRSGIKKGSKVSKKILRQPVINVGDAFVLYGQIAYVASAGEDFYNKNDRKDQRMKVVFDNETESEMLMRSMQRALEKDEAGRRIVNVTAGPLFDSLETSKGEYTISGDAPDDNDQTSGTIYVLRSESKLDAIAKNRDVIHKIGVTGGKVEKRIANAKDDATYLLADVKIVATYPLFGIDRNKLEKLIHRFFESSRLDIEIKDRFGKPVKPREWFLVPLYVIDELVDRIKDGSIEHYKYDVETATLVRHEI